MDSDEARGQKFSPGRAGPAPRVSLGRDVHGLLQTNVRAGRRLRFPWTKATPRCSTTTFLCLFPHQKKKTSIFNLLSIKPCLCQRRRSVESIKVPRTSATKSSRAISRAIMITKRIRKPRRAGKPARGGRRQAGCSRKGTRPPAWSWPQPPLLLCFFISLPFADKPPAKKQSRARPHCLQAQQVRVPLLLGLGGSGIPVGGCRQFLVLRASWVLRFCPACYYLSNSGLFARPFVIFLDVPGISSICWRVVVTSRLLEAGLVYLCQFYRT